MEQTEYLKQYETTLADHLIEMLTRSGDLGGKLLTTDDFYHKWDEMAPSYLADLLKEVNSYPTVSLGWAMYLGMAVARYWDDEWDIYSKVPDLYEYLRNKRGYDNMDEYIREEVLGLKGEDFDKAEDLVRSCASQTLSRIRHEQVEAQSAMAYYIYVSSVKVLFHLGASVELKKLGYNLEKVNM